MTLSLLLLGVVSLLPQQDDLVQLLEEAQALHEQIEKNGEESKDTRSDRRALLELCTRLRRAAPTSLPLCLNEGNAAALARDWPHALLAFNLAQRLAPHDQEAAARLKATRARLVLPDQPVSVWEEAGAALGANSLLGASLWLVAFLLYGMAWVQLAGLTARAGSGTMLGMLGIATSVTLAVLMLWAGANRRHQLGQTLGVIKRGEPVVVREGNGISYPAATRDPLRAGAEIVVVSRRGEWLQIRSSRGQLGWIPGSSAELE